MSIEKEPFRLENLGGPKRDIIPIALNLEERELLEKIKRILKQPKDSTAIKQMLNYGLKNLIQDQATAYLLSLQFKNYRNSQISGNFAEDAKNDDL
jgi:hypothetical protein